MKRTEVESIEGNSASALAHAACRNDVSEVFRLLNRGNVRTICVEQLGSMPIHCAALFGEAELVNHIIRLDPSTVNDKDLEGDTPLHIAARGGHMEVVRVLLEGNADHKDLNNENRLPLSLVDLDLRKQYFELIDELRPSKDPIKEGVARLLGFLGVYKANDNPITARSTSSEKSARMPLRPKND